MENESPFYFGKLVAINNFIDRDAERKKLISNFNFGINTILLSPRRWGKSSLILQAAKEASKANPKLRFAFIDCFAVRTEEQFYNLFTQMIIKAVSSKWQERANLVTKVFKSIVPKLNMSLDATNEFSVALDFEGAKNNPEEILNLAEKIAIEKNIKLIVCIDEFQNIKQFEFPYDFLKKMLN